MIKPIKKKSVYKTVFDSLVTLIDTGEIKVGEKLPTEAELVEQFQVGRNSIREALKSLEILDVISSQSGVGMIVSENAIRNINLIGLMTNTTSASQIREMWEARLIIEPQITELAILKATDEERQAIYDIALKSTEDYKNGEYKWELGMTFHQLINQAADNALLDNFLNIVNDIAQTRVEFIIHTKNGHELLRSELLDNHMKIAECFIKKDAAKGRDIMYAHIKRALDYIDNNKDFVLEKTAD